MLVAGDAASMSLAAGLWLEGVNFAIGAGLAAGRAADRAIAAGDDCSARGLASYRRRPGVASFVLADHKRLRKAADTRPVRPGAAGYPGLACDFVERMFTVTNPTSQARHGQGVLPGGPQQQRALRHLAAATAGRRSGHLR